MIVFTDALAGMRIPNTVGRASGHLAAPFTEAPPSHWSERMKKVVSQYLEGIEEASGDSATAQESITRCLEGWRSTYESWIQ